MMAHKYVLGLSGGKDSAALAIFMKHEHPELDIEYFFTDTGKELPEVYEYLNKLEGFLGKPILRLNEERGFDFWLEQYGNYLPSAQTRWCTRQLKLLPFKNWVNSMLREGHIVHSLVAIRSDEEHRDGYSSHHENLHIHFPFREAGYTRNDVFQLLNDSPLGIPKYYEWRSRSGCTFCFFQQKIEWVNLKERHPEAFEEAKRYEKKAKECNSPFLWSQGESLEDLEQPQRIIQIKSDFEARKLREKNNRPVNALHVGLEDIDELYFSDEGNGACNICHK
ncbi:phosphoadenosine phosphosulfate reductase family protein [Vibrio sp. Y20_XG_PY13]|uniref:phosphoadenosine phosphosulfate reductase family protein n=1 Tax=Vibrio sp. Y20_XG_PY13 TaxID=2957761 RepID=UPI0020A513CF|nr:phosphoadenosine phosphosulfate reductase family protein [Vibrio sp. Y20_XG_PY13]